MESGREGEMWVGVGGGLLITAVKESLIQKGGLPHEPPSISALLTLNPDVLVLILSHFSSALRFNFSAASSEHAGAFSSLT